MPRTRTLLSIVAIPLLVLLIACGGGDDDDGSSSGSSGGSDGGNNQSSQNSGGSGNNNASDDDIAENCPELLKFVGAAAGGFGPGQDLDDIEIDADLFTNMARSAPSEIRADMQVLAQAMTAFFDKLEDLDVDFANPATFATLTEAELDELEEITAELDTPRVTQAVEKIEAYFDRVCS